jgi:quercetin dioxygenase-like cupin family protein
MMTRRTLIESAALLLLAQQAGAQQPPANRNVVFQHDLPNVNLDNWAVTAVEVPYAPGQASNPHRHPGITIAYVLEGEIRSKVGDGPEKSYTVGQMFIEGPGELHAVSRNASDSKPAKLLAILMAEKGKPLTTPEKH